MTVRVYVANLPVDAREDALRDFFSGYGCVHSVHVIRRTGSPLTATSYCVVEMHKGSRVKQAVRALDGQYLRGRLLDVEMVEAPRPAR